VAAYSLAVPSTLTSPAVAAVARRCEALSRVHRLATWGNEDEAGAVAFSRILLEAGHWPVTVGR
jgi:hypothetical protein